MTTTDTTTTVTVGEGGLGAYIAFAESMAATCREGFGVCETTLNDMYGRGWSGERTAGIEQGREALGAAQLAFQAAESALRASLAVAEAYDANEGTGDRESTRNR